MKIFARNKDEIGILHPNMPNGLCFLHVPNTEEWNYYQSQDAWFRPHSEKIYWMLLPNHKTQLVRLFYAKQEETRIFLTINQSFDILEQRNFREIGITASFRSFSGANFTIRENEECFSNFAKTITIIHETLQKIKKC